MAVVVVGLHERDAPLEIFEKIAISDQDLSKALAQLTGGPNVSEAVVLSTCLRTEIYAVVERFHAGLSDIEAWLRSRIGDDWFGPDTLVGEQGPQPAGGAVELGGKFVCWYDEAAVQHLFEVAGGIDSPVLGEGEILRQVRDAAESARTEGAIGSVLGPLFRHAVEAGKRVRTETAIQRGSTSLAHAVVEVAADHALGLGGRKILLVGAGEMGAGIARALSGRSDLTGHVVVANRSEDRGHAVADMVAGSAIGLDNLLHEVETADVVITSTSAGEVLLDAERLREVVAHRSARGEGGQLVIVDAAVPRDVDPDAGTIDGVRLLDMEDVRRHAEEQMAGREAELPAVRALLGEELERYRTTAAGRMAAPVVSAFREHAELLRASELDRYKGRLDALSTADRELVETITRRMVAKLLHEPTVQVKEAAGSPRGERLAEALRTLFDL